MQLTQTLIKAHLLLDAATVSDDIGQILQAEEQLRDLSEFLRDTLDPPPKPLAEPRKQDGDARAAR